MANRTKRIATMLAALMVSTSASLAGGPVDEKLVIDGEVEIMTRVPAPEGHPFDELISGWHYRTEETRDLEADSFQNPGMLYVERGEEIWNTVDGAAGKSCAQNAPAIAGLLAQKSSSRHVSSAAAAAASIIVEVAAPPEDL